MYNDIAFRRELAIKAVMAGAAVLILMSYVSAFAKLDTIFSYALLSIPAAALGAAFLGSVAVTLTGAAAPGRADIFTRWWAVSGWLAIAFGALVIAAI